MSVSLNVTDGVSVSLEQPEIELVAVSLGDEDTHTVTVTDELSVLVTVPEMLLQGDADAHTVAVIDAL